MHSSSKKAMLTKSDLVKDVIRLSNQIKDQLIIIKLPSLIIEKQELLNNFVDNVRLIHDCGAKIFIVHDHTNLVQNTLELFGCDEKLINGTKVADHKSSQLIEMVVSGHINKMIVSKLCNAGCNAIGISGKDCNLIQAKQSKLLYKKRDNQGVIDTGFTSEPIMISPEILLHFEDLGIVPVISPIASDEKGQTQLLDVNLTTAIITSALNADHLILPCAAGNLTELQPKMEDSIALKSLLSGINDPSLASLIETAICVIENNIGNIHLVDQELEDSILLSLFTLGGPAA